MCHRSPSVASSRRTFRGPTGWLALGLFLAFAPSAHGQARLTGGGEPAALEDGWELHWDSPGDDAAELARAPSGAPGWSAVHPGVPPPGRNGRALAWFHVRLPAGSWSEPALYIQGMDTRFELFADGAPIYKFGALAPETSRLPRGAPWHLVRLPPDSGGKMLALHVYSASPFDIGPVGVAVGSRSDLLARMIGRGMGSVTVALLALCIGVLGIGVFIRRREETAYLAFAAFALARGAALLATADLRQLIWDSPQLWAYVLAFARLAVGPSLVAYTAALASPAPRSLRRLWVGAAAVDALAAVGLLIHFEWTYRLAWRFINLEILVCVLAALLAAGRDALRGKRDAQLLLLGVAGFLAGTLHDGLSSSHLIEGAAPWDPWTTLVLLLAMGTILLGRFVDVYRSLQQHAAALHEKNLQLESTRAELAHAVASRDDFLSVASHELRTPLTALLLQLDTLESTSSTRELEARLRAVLPAMRRQGTRLSRLTEVLFDVTRIQAGKVELSLERFALVGVVEAVIERLQPEARSAGAEISLDAEPGIEGVWDRERLDQVVTNLLANAVKYGEGKPIRIELRRTEGGARISVIDQGRGIAPEDQRRIFERFERAAGRLQPGLGLGLWIAKGLIDAHGGAISVASRLGHGATFIVDLPCQARRAEPT